jgi:hypothetical protein
VGGDGEDSGEVVLEESFGCGDRCADLVDWLVGSSLRRNKGVMYNPDVELDGCGYPDGI